MTAEFKAEFEDDYASIIIEDEIIPSIKQTKKWRQTQVWYDGGRRTECENYQKKLITIITETECKKTHARIRVDTNTLELCSNPYKNDFGFEYTENFDIAQDLGGKKLFYNLKMVCDRGGAQTRSLWIVYNFIKAQIKLLERTKEYIFINILDGDESAKNHDKFRYLLSKCQAYDNIFCGDMHEFKVWYLKFKNENIKMPSQKSQLGQFFTTNADYILQGLEIPRSVEHVIEPFAGNGDLLPTSTFFKLECYDIDPKKDFIVGRDTLLDPPNYLGKFVLTNPPYLARNKSKDKSIFDKYGMNDLYKCFLKELLTNKCIGGIIIIPLNFWCSIRKNDVDLRKKFLDVYKILRVNVFLDKVFDDTGYSVCSFLFELKSEENHHIPFFIYPNGCSSLIEFSKTNNYTIGGELYNLPKNTKYSISRLIDGDIPTTNIIAKCLDDKGNENINLKIVDDTHIFYDKTPNKSARTFATLLISPPISLERQTQLVSEFNEFLKEKRAKYNSLFMSNYREAGRKRISFDLVYDIVGYLLLEK